jgi:hypothetical protein
MLDYAIAGLSHTLGRRTITRQFPDTEDIGEDMDGSAALKLL